MITRETALSWYPEAYENNEYKMGLQRKMWAIHILSELPKGSFFDVGCGRGEMIEIAYNTGHRPSRGCETVPDLIGGVIYHGLAHDLPCRDNEYDTVTMFDVMEHLTEADCMSAINELKRVAKKHIILSISNRPSIVNGIDLHITKKPYDEWDKILREYIPGTITHLKHDRPCVCEMWRIDL